ncbi:MAG: CDP-alcohol phosphatidyltransferase family protein [Patescibacteria group bacterium]
MKRNIANFITLSRIVLTGPALIILCYSPISPQSHVLLFVLVLWCAISDKLDGLAARLWGSTAAGKWLDPLADKVLILIFVPLYFHGMIHLLPVIIIVLRDTFSTILRHYYAREVIGAKTSGKIKTVVNLTCMCSLVAALPVPGSYLSPLSGFREMLYYTTGILISAVCIWSGLDYYRKIVVQQQV